MKMMISSLIFYAILTFCRYMLNFLSVFCYAAGFYMNMELFRFRRGQLGLIWPGMKNPHPVLLGVSKAA
jgi:hypothetical protein